MYFLKATLFRQTDVQLHHREIGKRQEADFSLFKGEACRPLNGILLLFLVVVVEPGTCQEKWAAGDFRQVWVSVWIYSDAGAFFFLRLLKQAEMMKFNRDTSQSRSSKTLLQIQETGRWSDLTDRDNHPENQPLKINCWKMYSTWTGIYLFLGSEDA